MVGDLKPVVRARRADLGVAGVAHLSGPRSQAVAGAELDDLRDDPDFWERAGDVCGLYLNPPDNAVVWSVDEKTGMQATTGSTRPARRPPVSRRVASPGTAATAPPCCSRPWTSTTAPSPDG